MRVCSKIKILSDRYTIDRGLPPGQDKVMRFGGVSMNVSPEWVDAQCETSVDPENRFDLNRLYGRFIRNSKL
jgi:hypothetical protein